MCEAAGLALGRHQENIRAGVELAGQVFNYGGVTNWKSVGQAALQWGALNTFSAFASAVGEAFSIEQIDRYTTEIFKMVMSNIGITTLVGCEGFVLDWARGVSN